MTLQMAGYILEIFRYYPAVVMSWGIDLDTIRPITDSSDRYGVEFSVNGFKHQGKVQILYDDGSDTFMYHLLDGSDKITATRECIFVDNLVPSIDADVEKVENYEERIRQNPLAHTAHIHKLLSPPEYTQHPLQWSQPGLSIPD